MTPLRFAAATSAFQIEGAAWEDGRRDSIWDAFCRVPGAVIDGHDAVLAERSNLVATELLEDIGKRREEVCAVAANPLGDALHSRVLRWRVNAFLREIPRPDRLAEVRPVDDVRCRSVIR